MRGGTRGDAGEVVGEEEGEDAGEVLAKMRRGAERGGAGQKDGKGGRREARGTREAKQWVVRRRVLPVCAAGDVVGVWCGAWLWKVTAGVGALWPLCVMRGMAALCCQCCVSDAGRGCGRWLRAYHQQRQQHQHQQHQHHQLHH